MRFQLIGLALLSAGLVLFGSAPSWAADKPSMENGPIMTAKEATALIATAKTPKNHKRLALYFSQEADRLEADAGEHDQMIVAYRNALYPRSMKTPGASGTIEHCESLAKSDREMAKALREMAEAHEEMAEEAGKR